MSTIGFRKASKKKAKLRLAVWGPPKAGKTRTSLEIGKWLAKILGTKIAFIDTERESADYYADVCDFDTDSSMTEFAPSEYVKRIRAAGEAGYGVLIVDSLSHAWAGTGGTLEMKDAAQKKQAAKSGTDGNSWTAWRDVTPEHNKLVEALLQYPGHVIVTIRSKVEYEQVKGANGKSQVRKVGLAPIQREGLEYEFTMLAQINEEHDLIVSGSRIPTVDGKVYHCAGEEFARECLAWLEQGEDVKPAQPTPAPETKAVDPLAPVKRAVWAELARLKIGDGMEKADMDVARVNCVARVNGGKRPETSGEWDAVLAQLKAEETVEEPAPLDNEEAAALERENAA